VAARWLTSTISIGEVVMTQVSCVGNLIGQVLYCRCLVLVQHALVVVILLEVMGPYDEVVVHLLCICMRLRKDHARLVG